VSIEVEMQQCGLTQEEKHVHRLLNGFGPPYAMTLREIGEIFDISYERVRQIEDAVLRKIRHTKKFKQHRKRMIDLFEMEKDDMSLINRVEKGYGRLG